MTARLRRRALVTAALLLLALVHGWHFRQHLTDDAFIPFRYLANLFAGHGLVYNPGERVWGYTNFLWIALLAPPIAGGIDPLAAARALGLLSNAVVLVWVLAFLPADVDATRRWNPAGAALLATSGPFLLQASERPGDGVLLPARPRDAASSTGARDGSGAGSRSRPG